jgi:hypothetical protein
VVLGSFLLLAAALWAGDFKTNVGVVPTLLLGGPVNPIGVSAWVASTVYKPGEYVTFGLFGPSFVCISTNSTGASGTTLPGPGIGSDVVDNNVTWRPVLTRQRSLLVLENRGTGKVTVGLHGVVVGVGTGLVLDASAKIGLTGTDCPQSAVWVMSEAGTTNEVGGTEK